MRVELERRAGDGRVLRCTRAGGSVTWQKHDRHGEFFAAHDLTHFAVESVLGARNGFFGLVAQGWQIEDTTGKGARGPLPEEAVAIERLVGMLDTERAGSTLWTAAEFNQSSGAPPLSDDQLHRIRARRSELLKQWNALTPGTAMTLLFE